MDNRPSTSVTPTTTAGPGSGASPPASNDPRRPEKIKRFRLTGLVFEDFTSDYMSVIGMLFSMFGLMMRMKWCAWIAIYCSCIGFASSRVQDDAKQIFSSFMLSISAVVMSYLQNPSPMTMPLST